MNPVRNRVEFSDGFVPSLREHFVVISEHAPSWPTPLPAGMEAQFDELSPVPGGPIVTRDPCPDDPASVVYRRHLARVAAGDDALDLLPSVFCQHLRKAMQAAQNITDI